MTSRSKFYIFLSIFLLNHFYIACENNVNTTNATGVEKDVKYDVEREISQLKELVNKQSELINETTMKITRLEALLEKFVEGNNPWLQLNLRKQGPTLKVERGSGELKAENNTRRGTQGEIAFVAYMNHFHTSKEYPPGSILPFEMTTLNYGNHYNKTSGLFTCPTSGLYKLDWALAYYYQNTTSASMDSPPEGRDYLLDVDFTIVYLNKSDTAGVTNPDDNGVFMPYFSKFSGFQISG